MQFFFDIPSIQDNIDLTKLIDKNQVQPQQWAKIEQAQDFRLQFKNMMQIKQICELVQLQDGLVNYQQVMEQYLKINVDMLEYIGYNKSSKLPVFEYTSFLSKNKDKYTTDNIEKPEAFAAELLMVRYSFCFAYQLDAFKYLQIVKDMVLQNYSESKNNQNQILDYMPEQQKQFKQQQLQSLNQNIDKTLECYSIGYEKIKKVHGVINDLLYFLVQKQNTLVPELKATTLYSIKMILECNANYIYIEKLVAGQMLKEDNSYKIAQVAKATVTKLSEVQGRFNDIKSEIKDDVFHYLNVAVPFFQVLGMVNLAKDMEVKMKNENYPQGKNYTTMSCELLQIGQYIVQQYKNVMQLKCLGQEMSYLPYAQKIFSDSFLPYGQRIVSIHSGTQKNSYNTLSATDLLLAVPALDYFQDILKK